MDFRLDNALSSVMHLDGATTSIRSTVGYGRSHVDFHNVNKLISGPVAPELEHTTRRLSASGSVDASISLASNTSNPVAAQENKINSLPWINEKRGSHRPQKSAPISTDVISSTSSGFPTSVRASSLYSSDTELYVGHSDSDGADDHIFFTSKLMDDPTLPSSIDYFTTSLVGPPRQRPRHGRPSDLVNTTTPSTRSHSTIPLSTPLDPALELTHWLVYWQQKLHDERDLFLHSIAVKDEAIHILHKDNQLFRQHEAQLRKQGQQQDIVLLRLQRDLDDSAKAQDTIRDFSDVVKHQAHLLRAELNRSQDDLHRADSATAKLTVERDMVRSEVDSLRTSLSQAVQDFNSYKANAAAKKQHFAQEKARLQAAQAIEDQQWAEDAAAAKAERHLLRQQVKDLSKQTDYWQQKAQFLENEIELFKRTLLQRRTALYQSRLTAPHPMSRLSTPADSPTSSTTSSNLPLNISPPLYTPASHDPSNRDQISHNQTPSHSN